MKIAKPDPAAKVIFKSLIPVDRRVSEKLMFGNDAAFANGNLFFGVYGEDLFVRLPDELAGDLIKAKGSGRFEPVKGHTMKGYYVVPRSWHRGPSPMKEWVSKSLEWTLTLPPKKGKK